MPDAGRFTPQKSNHTGEAPADALRNKQGQESDKPGLKVTFERPETREAIKSAETSSRSTTTAVPEPAAASLYSAEAGKHAKSDDSKSGALTLIEQTSSEEAATSERQSRDVPTVGGLLSAPLLALIAAASLAAAGWSYTKLNETRTLLTSTTEALAAATAENASASQAKITAEKALSESRTRLQAVEKSVSDIKAALAAIASGAPAAANAAAPGDKATEKAADKSAADKATSKAPANAAPATSADKVPAKP